MATYKSIKYAFSGSEITDPSILASPTVQSISPASLSEGALPAAIAITGTQFTSGSTVNFISATGASIASPSVGFQSATALQATVPATVTDAGEPWDVQVQGTIAGQKDNVLSIDGNPAFTTAAGSLGTITDGTRSTYSLAAATATDPEGVTVTHAITTGSVSPGLTFNAPAGTITGTAAAVPSGSVTSSFTVRATAGAQTTDRAFTITVSAPVTQAITTTGAGTFSAPFTGTMTLLAIGSGGGSGSENNGGGGGGGLVLHPSYSVQSGTSYPYVVAASTSANPRSTDTTFGAGSGTDTTFITAMGGGNGGGSYDGGSGGGKSHSPGSGGLGIQTTSPAISADSRTYGFGNNGGAAGTHAYPGHPSGGGGGAGGVGGNGSGSSTAGNGGPGKDVSATFGTTHGASGVFAGGGGGGIHQTGSWGSGGSGGGGGRNQSGTANTGGGGGAGSTTGASGIIILKY
jgi:hypothetical protein